MALRDIIGHEKAINILTGCIARNRIPHAFLFAGDDGIGKKLTAINFAKALNCTGNKGHGPEAGSTSLFGDTAHNEPDLQLHVQHDACDNCPSCKKIDSGNHPDLSIIVPEGDSSQITVSSVRSLEESLSFKPFEGNWKIAIIDSADRLNQSASNAFLHTLEEPSPQSVLILVSSRPDAIIPTILSRCQRISFSPLPAETMSTLLEEKLKSRDHERMLLLSLLSGGSVGHAMNEDLIDNRDRSFEILKQMLDGSEEEIWESREEMHDWFEWGQLWLRDIAVFRATERTDLLINQDMTEEIMAISGRAVLKDILKLAREFYNIKKNLNFNLNKQLTSNYTSLLLQQTLASC